MLKTAEKTGQQTAVSKSVIKSMRNKFFQHVLFDQEQIPTVWPKKGKVVAYKLKNSTNDHKYQLISVDKDSHFVSVDGYVFPSLKVLHAYPDMYPKFVVDEGAIKAVLKGANVMSPGLLSEHGRMDDVQEDRIVGVYVHGHQHAIGIGVTKKSTQSIKADKQGEAVTMIHVAGDGFWNIMYKE